MRSSNTSDTTRLLVFLRTRQRAGQRLVSKTDVMAYLGLEKDDAYYTLVESLRRDGLVGTGIGIVTLELAGEEYLLSPDEERAVDALGQRLVAELEQEVSRRSQADRSLANSVEDVTGKPSTARTSFSDTFELAQRMGVDPFSLRLAALRLVRNHVIDRADHELYDRVYVRVRPVDLKALMDVHDVLYNQNEDGK